MVTDLLSFTALIVHKSFETISRNGRKSLDIAYIRSPTPAIKVFNGEKANKYVL